MPRSDKGQMKKTRQGVRDLNHIKGKSVGRKLEMPPISQMCNHPPDKRCELHMGAYVEVWCSICDTFLGDY